MTRFESRTQGEFSHIDGVYDSLYEYSKPISYAFSADFNNVPIVSPFGPDSECMLLGTSTSQNILGNIFTVSFDAPQGTPPNNQSPAVNGQGSGYVGYQLGSFYSAFNPPELWIPVSQAVYVGQSFLTGGVHLGGAATWTLVLAWRMKRVFETPTVEDHKGFTEGY